MAYLKNTGGKVYSVPDKEVSKKIAEGWTKPTEVEIKLKFDPDAIITVPEPKKAALPKKQDGDAQASEDITVLRIAYQEKFGKNVSVRYKNDPEWIVGKLKEDE